MYQSLFPPAFRDKTIARRIEAQVRVAHGKAYTYQKSIDDANAKRQRDHEDAIRKHRQAEHKARVDSVRAHVQRAAVSILTDAGYSVHSSDDDAILQKAFELDRERLEAVASMFGRAELGRSNSVDLYDILEALTPESNKDAERRATLKDKLTDSKRTAFSPPDKRRYAKCQHEGCVGNTRLSSKKMQGYQSGESFEMTCGVCNRVGTVSRAVSEQPPNYMFGPLAAENGVGTCNNCGSTLKLVNGDLSDYKSGKQFTRTCGFCSKSGQIQPLNI